MLLERHGAIVHSQASGVAACDALQSSPLAQWPDLLICDIALGEGEDGYSVVRRIRAIESAAKIALDQRLPAIALSGYNEAEDRARALVAGFQIHLGKPVDPAELIITIASMASRRPRNLQAARLSAAGPGEDHPAPLQG